MIPNKRSIMRSFSHAAQTYDGSSGLQTASAAELIEFAGRYAGRGLDGAWVGVEKILDVGAGTGHLTTELKALNPNGSVVAIDIAEPMIRVLKGKGLTNNGIAADFDALPFLDETFSLLASNLAYQWSTDKRASFAEAYRVLESNGRLIAATLGATTLPELRECYTDKDRLISFDTPEGLRSVLSISGFKDIEIESRTLRFSYTNFLELISTLHRTGAVPEGGLADVHKSSFALRRAQRLYDERYRAEGFGVYATYELVLISALKRP